MKKKIAILLSALVLVIGMFSVSFIMAGASTPEPELSIPYCNLSFRDSVCIKYAVKSNVSDVKILIWTSPEKEYTVGTQDAEITEYYEEDIYGETHKIFDYTELTAKQMTDYVYSVAYIDVDGERYYSAPNKFSVIEYAYSNNTKLSKEVLSNRILIDGKFHVLNVFDDTNIKIALRHKTDKDFRFEQVDPLILGAIGSFHENGIYHFTTDMIARMIYQDTHHRVTEQVKQKLQARIDAMMDLQIRFNIEEECLARQSNPKDDRLSNKRYTPFLPMKPIKAV